MKYFLLLSFFFIIRYSHSQEISGIISKVTDGDSFELLTSDQRTRIRLFGIDCPEINQPYGDSATYYLNEFLNDSVIVIIRDIDRYGRTVGDVFYKDTLINYNLIALGLAWHYKKYSDNNILSEAELEAKNNGVGIWSDSIQIAPWDWRSGNYDKSILQTNSALKFFVCVGKENNGFHTVHYCEELKKCHSSTVLITQAEAQEVYHKERCPVCIQTN